MEGPFPAGLGNATTSVRNIRATSVYQKLFNPIFYYNSANGK